MSADPDVTRTLVTFLTGSAGVGLVAAIVRSIGTLRTGALSSTRAVVKDLVDARNEAEARQDVADRRSVFWQDAAVRYRRQLLEANIRPDPFELKPPAMNPADASRRANRDAGRRRRDQEMEDTGDILG